MTRCAHRLWNMALAKRLLPDHRMVLIVLADHIPGEDDPNRRQLQWEAEQFQIKVAFVTTPAEAVVLIQELDQIDRDDLMIDDPS